ncbi:MAG: hypothetical protein LUE64_01055 [Candidatus Gastranaerophilales bacterium]|nr:hypothetical protein [Candidatus Gastranaerophilales bacterium]
MDAAVRILLGVIAGIIFGLFAAAASIKKKEQKLLIDWQLLSDTLNIRYSWLQKYLSVCDRYMNKFHSDIEALNTLIIKAINEEKDIKFLNMRLLNENNINYKLEAIKTSMADYPLMEGDSEMQGIINSIIESEIAVGKAIQAYNNSNLQYKIFLETFPISIVTFLLNKKTDIPPFMVTQANEFDDNYIDEDEI